jgi:hypothetical protein
MKVIGWLRKRSDRVISKRKLVLATSETVADIIHRRLRSVAIACQYGVAGVPPEAG